jgi:hypothetical protein
MSFFTKLFGPDEKKNKAPPPPPPSKTEAEQIAEKKIKIEAALNDLDVKIKSFEEKEKKFEYKIEVLKNKAKELIAADKKKDAKKYVEEATKVQKQAEVIIHLDRVMHLERKCCLKKNSNSNRL